MSNLNNDNNKDLSNNKIINNTADLSKNILKIDISNNYPRFTLGPTNRYFLNLNNNTHNSKLPPLHTPKEKKLRNNVIYKSNKESDTNDIDTKIRNLIDKIRQERLNLSKKIDAYENKKKDISYNFTYTGVNTIYKDFTRSTEITEAVAPNTFRIEISRALCSAENDANPKSPIQAIPMATRENRLKLSANRCSDSYI